MYRKTILKLCAVALVISGVLSACAHPEVDDHTTESQPVFNTSEVSDFTTEKQSVFNTEVSESQTQIPDSPVADLDIQYSQSASAIYSADGIDFVATTNGIGIVEPGKEMRMLNNQKTAPRLMIIDNVIYYTVINDIYETTTDNVEGEPMSILFAQCECWSMNLDGTNQKKLFSYFGNGWVVYRQDNTVFYIDDVSYDEFRSEKAKILKLCKIDLITGKTETIIYLPNDGAGNIIWGMMDTCYHTIYTDGYLIIASRSQEVCSYIYDIEKNEVVTAFICLLKPANDGSLYAIENVMVPEGTGHRFSHQELVKYNVKNNSIENMNIRLNESVGGEIFSHAYSDDGIIFGKEVLYIYTPESGLKNISDIYGYYACDVFCNADNKFSYISSMWSDADNSYKYYLTDHLDAETSNTVTLDDFPKEPDEFNYSKINMGANVKIYFCDTKEYFKTHPANVFYSNYTISYK